MRWYSCAYRRLTAATRWWPDKWGTSRMPEGAREKHWTRRHLLDIQGLSRGEMEHLFAIAGSFREVSTRSVKKVPALRGRVVVNLFYEPSTRTRISFTLAA